MCSSGARAILIFMKRLIKALMPFLIGISFGLITAIIMLSVGKLIRPDHIPNWVDGVLLGWFSCSSYEFGKNKFKI